MCRKKLICKPGKNNVIIASQVVPGSSQVKLRNILRGSLLSLPKLHQDISCLSSLHMRCSQGLKVFSLVFAWLASTHSSRPNLKIDFFKSPFCFNELFFIRFTHCTTFYSFRTSTIFGYLRIYKWIFLAYCLSFLYSKFYDLIPF